MGVLVYSTKSGKEWTIHPDMAKDKLWMAARGLIVKSNVKSFTNMNPPPSGTPALDIEAIRAEERAKILAEIQGEQISADYSKEPEEQPLKEEPKQATSKTKNK